MNRVMINLTEKEACCKTVNELRSHIYYHNSKGLSIEKLPPTSFSLKYHILMASTKLSKTHIVVLFKRILKQMSAIRMQFIL